MKLYLLIFFFHCLHASPQNRIVGGTLAKKGQFPYIVSIRNWGLDHFCAGVIINEHWILTAAHCIKSDIIGNALVHAGINSRFERGDSYHIEKHITHPNYIGIKNLYLNDIALIKTYSRIHFNHLVQPIYLDSHFIQGGSQVTVSGWGMTSFEGVKSSKLLYLKSRTIRVEECEYMMKGLSNISSSQICTFTRVGEATCNADSGGPLEYEGALVGIVSFGYRCGAGYPDVYTRVAFYLDWIHDTIKHN